MTAAEVGFARLERIVICGVAVLLLCGCGGKYVVKGSQVKEKGAIGVEGGYEESATPVSSSATIPPEPPEAPEPASDLMEYTTEPGDTLASIAASYYGWGLLAQHLREWNKRGEGVGQPLPPGTRIVVPMRFKQIAGTRAAGQAATGLKPVKRPRRRNMRPATDVFNVGEKLSYNVKWHAITAGHATLTVAPMETVNGERCWHIVARAMSKLVFFFKVDDRLESVFTVDDFLPMRFEKHLHEGRYKKDVIATFYRDRHEAIWGQLHVPLVDDCRDLIGAFYYFRTMNLPAVGGESSVCIHTDKVNYPMAITVLRRETVRVPAGEFKTILIKPRLKFEGLWRQRGDVLIWLTDDASRVPVLVQSKVHLLGSVDVVLTGMERPK